MHGLDAMSGILVVIVLFVPLGEQRCLSQSMMKPKLLLHPADRIDAGGEPVDPVDAAEQRGLGIGCRANTSSGRDISFCATARTT